MKYIIPIITLLLLTSCSVFDANHGYDEPTYQATVEITNETIVVGYAPAIVYQAQVLEANRVMPDTALLDFTAYLKQSRGTLPFEFGKPFSVRLSREGNNTYRVEQSFYDY